MVFFQENPSRYVRYYPFFRTACCKQRDLLTASHAVISTLIFLLFVLIHPVLPSAISAENSSSVCCTLLLHLRRSIPEGSSSDTSLMLKMFA